MFPPAYCHVAAKRFAVIKVGPDDGSFKIQTVLHNQKGFQLSSRPFPGQASHRKPFRHRTVVRSIRNKNHFGTFEIKRQAIVPQEVAPNNARLLKSRGFVDQIKIKSHRSEIRRLNTTEIQAL